MDMLFDNFLRKKTTDSYKESMMEEKTQTLTHLSCFASGAVKIAAPVKSENLDDSCFYESSLQSNSIEETSSIHKTNSSFSIESCSSSSFSESKSSSFKSLSTRDSFENEFFFKKEFNHEYVSNSNLLKQELIEQLCIDIDTKHQNLNKTISGLVSNCGDLKLNGKFWNYVINDIGLISFLNDSVDEDSDEVFLSKKHDLMKNFYNLLLCLNKLEKELAIYLNRIDGTGVFSFDAEFFLGLAFLVFEKVTNMTTSQMKSQNSNEKPNSNNIELVFELDMNTSNCYDDTIWLFELNLNNLLSNYVLKFLPDLIDLQKNNSTSRYVGSGRSSLEFFKNLLYKEKCDVAKTTSANFDIDILISKPCLDVQEFYNPITQSYKCLLNNLNTLKFFSHDPFLEADNEAAKLGRETNTISFGCLAFSYLSMGFFEIKMLLENSFQFLYEIQEFNHEIKSLFRRDANEHDTKSWMKSCKFTDDYEFENYQFNDKRKTNKTKWNIDLSNRQMKKEKCNSPKKKPIFDDIIHRISSLTIPILESQLKFVHDSDYLIQELNKHSSPLSSPTEIYKNDIVKLSNDSFNNFADSHIPVFNNFQVLNHFNQDQLNVMNVYDDFYENSKVNWPKTDPRPIGHKPASMTNLSYPCTNRNRFNKFPSVCVNSSIRQTSPKLDLSENFKLIWNANREQSSSIGTDDALKPNNDKKPIINKTLSPNPLKFKKYSVAPNRLLFNTKGLENQISSNLPTKARSVMSYSSDNKYSYLNQRLNENNKCFYSNELSLNEKTSTSSKRHTVSNMRHQNYLPDAYHYSPRY